MMTTDQIEALGLELDAIRNEVLADLGERDAAHIRRVVRTARASAIAGRSLLMFGFTPVSWTFGVAALATAKILENMEIGHNVMHGQYDWMNDPTLNSSTWDWDSASTPEAWKHSHNYVHHTYTNIRDKDRDLGYVIMRTDPLQQRHPGYLCHLS